MRAYSAADVGRYSTMKLVSSSEASVQDRFTALVEVADAPSPVGGGGGMVRDTGSLREVPDGPLALTRKP